MDCVCCGSAAVAERPERTAQGYRRFRCRDCGKINNLSHLRRDHVTAGEYRAARVRAFGMWADISGVAAAA